MKITLLILLACVWLKQGNTFDSLDYYEEIGNVIGEKLEDVTEKTTNISMEEEKESIIDQVKI